MEYISCAEAAAKWDISERRGQKPWEGERIPGAAKVSRVWVVTKNAAKPIGGGGKVGRELENDCENHFLRG